MRLVSRNGHDRTALFRAPFEGLAGLPPLVLDGEFAVPDQKGITHIDNLTTAMRLKHPERLTYFAFDLLHLDGHDLRPCAIEDRKALLRDVIGGRGMPAPRRGRPHCRQRDSALRGDAPGRGRGHRLEAGRQPYRCGPPCRDWLKTKVSETGAFVITGYIELQDGVLVPAGLVKFGLANKTCGRGSIRCVPAPRPVPGSSRCALSWSSR